MNFLPDEKHLSQIPALQLLINLGFEYLTKEGSLTERQGKLSNVLLEGILRERLKKLNRITYKGNEYRFSEENIQSAILKLKSVKYDGLQRTNELTYDLLTLGTSLEQTIEGDTKSYNLKFIDWENPANNVFHVTAEYAVERNRSVETARPDIVLFVNGIPLAAIECKAPTIAVEDAAKQSIRNQTDEYIPKLFTYTQLVMGVNKNAAMYATAGTGLDYWAVWNELRDPERYVAATVNNDRWMAQKDALFSGPFEPARQFFEAQAAQGPRLVTEQDKTIHSLCRPERLLELAYRFTLFDGGIKKIARYQQYFVIKSTLERVKQVDEDAQRRGGIIWHTQGSGKSLTMVMLTRSLALDKSISNPRIVLVTDRDDLDRQLNNTFTACGLEPKRATSGRDLLDLVSQEKAAIITTIINKFDKALNARKFRDESNNIFILVDESHRTNFGSYHARMKQMLPNACYLGFTGTPLLKREKNNFQKFGDLIQPAYPPKQAVKDKAVVPLLYEGRHVEIEQNQQAIDLWFERHTQGLSDAQKADLKRKYARSDTLQKTDRVVYMRAFDISEHFRANEQSTGFKGQLVAPDKATALKYKDYMDEIGLVTTEVLISAPDQRDGFEETDEVEPSDEVLRFWKKMMSRYGNKEDEYNKQIINQFKFGDDPEILIVVSKLLTGFDAPRNRVIYICKPLAEHNLLQAIARVNRLSEGKDYGLIVDYVGLLGELDKALTMYDALEGFDQEDLEGSLISVKDEIAKLPQRYSDVWDVFKTVKNSYDEEAYERHLFDQNIRDEFYERLTLFAKTLALALSTEDFLMKTDEETLRRYREDLKRFYKLRMAVKRRYHETVDFKEYDPKIKKLLDTHLQANEVIQLNKPVDIFDEAAFNQVKEEQGVYEGATPASRADTIAHAMKKTITEKMEEDPAFYEKFSKLLQKIIDDFRAHRISELEYLNKVTTARDDFVSGKRDDAPAGLQGNAQAVAFYGVIKPYFAEQGLSPEQLEKVSVETALVIDQVFSRHWKVDFWDDDIAKNAVRNDIDDYFFDVVKGEHGVELSGEQMDKILERTFQVAYSRNKT
jgi:type I restriction enzyme R subunit